MDNNYNQKRRSDPPKSKFCCSSTSSNSRSPIVVTWAIIAHPFCGGNHRRRRYQQTTFSENLDSTERGNAMAFDVGEYPPRIFAEKYRKFLAPQGILLSPQDVFKNKNLPPTAEDALRKAFKITMTKLVKKRNICAGCSQNSGKLVWRRTKVESVGFTIVLSPRRRNV
ncbi:uncharacterized protein LOC143038203 [Oratosquilla oratoria]|uniref:uncharacterized protein LOC143038203 n=1 Tax=Oratosquilla oratoria TaxID=337810 RepID=UPI003F762CB3